MSFLSGMMFGSLLTLTALGAAVWFLVQGASRSSLAHILQAAALALGRQKPKTPERPAETETPAAEGKPAGLPAPPVNLLTGGGKKKGGPL